MRIGIHYYFDVVNRLVNDSKTILSPSFRCMQLLAFHNAFHMFTLHSERYTLYKSYRGLESSVSMFQPEPSRPSCASSARHKERRCPFSTQPQRPFPPFWGRFLKNVTCPSFYDDRLSRFFKR